MRLCHPLRVLTDKHSGKVTNRHGQSTMLMIFTRKKWWESSMAIFVSLPESNHWHFSAFINIING